MHRNTIKTYLFRFVFGLLILMACVMLIPNHREQSNHSARQTPVKAELTAIQPAEVANATATENPEIRPATDAGMLNHDDRFRLALLATLASRDPADRETFFCNRAAPWAREIGNAALPLKDEIAARFGTDTANRLMLQIWAAEDAPAALRWACSQSEVETKNQMIASVCYQIAERDTEYALKQAQALLPSAALGSTLAAIVSRWAETDATEAMNWIRSFEPGPIRDKIVQQVVLVVVRNAPEAAIELAKATLSTPTAKHETAILLQEQIEQSTL